MRFSDWSSDVCSSDLLLGKSQPHAIERVGEPRLLDRLHQIIDRLCLERADRVVRISGDEDEQRRFDLHHPLNHRKAVETRHLDVEEDEIGLVGLDRANRSEENTSELQSLMSSS